jgi:hypothetical protein
MLNQGRIITQIVSTPSINPFLPSTLTAVCSDGTVWSKTQAPVFNLFGAMGGGHNGHSDWVPVATPPAPVQLQPVYIQAQPVVGAQQITQPMVQPVIGQSVLPQATVVPFMQPQPVQYTEHREYRSELQPHLARGDGQGQQGGQSGSQQHQGQHYGQPQRGTGGDREQGREQKMGMTGD